MSRDRRGNPGRFVLKNQPRLRLADVLRRRRTTLKVLIQELGITTYAGLDAWCGRMGIMAPEEREFHAVLPPTMRVNDASEGVVVLEAPPVIEESTGMPIDIDEPVDEPTEGTPKKRRAKKESQPAVS